LSEKESRAASASATALPMTPVAPTTGGRIVEHVDAVDRVTLRASTFSSTPSSRAERRPTASTTSTALSPVRRALVQAAGPCPSTPSRERFRSSAACRVSGLGQRPSSSARSTASRSPQWAEIATFSASGTDAKDAGLARPASRPQADRLAVAPPGGPGGMEGSFRAGRCFPALGLLGGSWSVFAFVLPTRPARVQHGASSPAWGRQPSPPRNGGVSQGLPTPPTRRDLCILHASPEPVSGNR
jgi:hypothetical protein